MHAKYRCLTVFSRCDLAIDTVMGGRTERLTHDCERDGVDDGLSEQLVRSMTLVDDVIVTLRHHDVHL